MNSSNSVSDQNSGDISTCSKFVITSSSLLGADMPGFSTSSLGKTNEGNTNANEILFLFYILPRYVLVSSSFHYLISFTLLNATFWCNSVIQPTVYLKLFYINDVIWFPRLLAEIFKPHKFAIKATTNIYSTNK